MRPANRSFTNRFTLAQLAELLRLEAQRIGRTPTRRDLESPERICPHLSTYDARFGTIARAQRAARLPVNDRGSGRRRWTRESVIAQLRYQARELGRTPYWHEFTVCRAVIERLFGSRREALVAAGLPLRNKQQNLVVGRTKGAGLAAEREQHRIRRAREMAEYWQVPMPIAS